jgi:hypothetical protein
MDLRNGRRRYRQSQNVWAAASIDRTTEFLKVFRNLQRASQKIINRHSVRVRKIAQVVDMKVTTATASENLLSNKGDDFI